MIRLRTISDSGGAPATLIQLTPAGDGAPNFEDQARLVTILPNGKVFEIGRVTVTHRGCDSIPQEHVPSTASRSRRRKAISPMPRARASPLSGTEFTGTRP